jgi:LPXTG-site transpeptidase (sortase) family protein
VPAVSPSAAAKNLAVELMDVTKRRHRRLLAVLALVALALGLASFAVAGSWALDARNRPSETQRFLPLPNPQAARVAAHQASARAGQMPRPVRVVIPAIRVSAPVIPLHLDRHRRLEVPTVWSQAGWFVGGPEPGENGAAVIVGHVDSKSGPAVFFRLRALRRGDVIKVVLKNKRTLRFVVQSSRRVPKKHFPTKLVYGRTKTPTLRLITCDGWFNNSTGHYVDDRVVFAALA